MDGLSNSEAYELETFMIREMKETGRYDLINKEARVGKFHSKETKAQMSRNRKGRTPWNKGKTYSIINNKAVPHESGE